VTSRLLFSYFYLLADPAFRWNAPFETLFQSKRTQSVYDIRFKSGVGAAADAGGNLETAGEGRGQQAVFARYLNVTTGLISQWERGEKHPQGASLKLLALVAKNGLNGVA
jgi:hypothetical protein